MLSTGVDFTGASCLHCKVHKYSLKAEIALIIVVDMGSCGRKNSICSPLPSGTTRRWHMRTGSIHSEESREDPEGLVRTLTCEAGGFGRQEGAPGQEEEQACFQQGELVQLGKLGQVAKVR
uniref:Uncharacterized protein n=1 Tax=Molossus molossus TaxID=27622 RepID=A0A7J8I047_MOLMO|nr:hypothetical protein HJG59_010885 [Molossus molossus]